LTLSNNSNLPLAFKVKTTAPKLYCVRPNASIIQPGESTKISIILQGFSQPLPKDYKCKDKFLLVSLPCPELSDAAKVGEAWPQLESKYKQQLVSKRLKVSYVITEGEGDDSNGNGTGSFDESHINQSQYNTTVINDATTAAATPLRSFNGSSPSNGHSSAGIAAGAAGAAGIAAASGVAASNLSTPSKYEGLKSQDLQKEIDASNARIKELNARLDSTLSPSTPSPAVAARANPVASSPQYAEKAAIHSQQQAREPEPVNGISLPLAVFLIILAFLLGWLVF